VAGRRPAAPGGVARPRRVAAGACWAAVAPGRAPRRAGGNGRSEPAALGGPTYAIPPDRGVLGPGHAGLSRGILSVLRGARRRPLDSAAGLAGARDKLDALVGLVVPGRSARLGGL